MSLNKAPIEYAEIPWFGIELIEPTEEQVNIIDKFYADIVPTLRKNGYRVIPRDSIYFIILKDYPEAVAGVNEAWLGINQPKFSPKLYSGEQGRRVLIHEMAHINVPPKYIKNMMKDMHCPAFILIYRQMLNCLRREGLL